MFCVITGAADGIGRSLAFRFARDGASVLGIDIDAEKAEQTKSELKGMGAQIAFVVVDLSKSSEIARVVDEVNKGPSIDLLVQNAGINETGAFQEIDPGLYGRLIDVNLNAPMVLTSELLSRQKIAGKGTIVFVSSLSYYTGYPGAAVYAATKNGIASYARSLSVALASQDINVLTVFPGPVRTAHAKLHSPNPSLELRRMTPEELTEKIFRAVKSRRHVLIPGFKNCVAARLGQWFPGLTDRTMRKVILEKMESAEPQASE